MTDDGQNGFSGADFFTRTWADFAGQMMRAGTAFTPGSTPPEMSQEMRSAMFKAWSEYCDQYMRSPEFLQMMKQSLSASLEARKQLNEFLGRMQHEFQGSTRQDVDEITATLHHMERRIVDGLDELNSRFQDLEKRIKQLEKQTAGGGRGGTAPKKKAAGRTTSS